MHLLKDLRFGFRSLVRSPGLTLVALVALALGIGVNATVFTLTNAVLFKGFPFDPRGLSDSAHVGQQFSPYRPEAGRRPRLPA
jgi:hypothetical protein